MCRNVILRTIIDSLLYPSQRKLHVESETRALYSRSTWCITEVSHLFVHLYNYIPTFQTLCCCGWKCTSSKSNSSSGLSTRWVLPLLLRLPTKFTCSAKVKGQVLSHHRGSYEVNGLSWPPNMVIHKLNRSQSQHSSHMNQNMTNLVLLLGNGSWQNVNVQVKQTTAGGRRTKHTYSRATALQIHQTPLVWTCQVASQN